MSSETSKSGRLKLEQYDAYRFHDASAVSLSQYLGHGKPTDFGVKVTKLFLSDDKFGFKPLTAATVGNIHETMEPRYQWTAVGQTRRPARITAFLETGNTRIGFANETFKIACDEPWFQEPDVLQLEHNEYPILVVGYPVQDGSQWIYTCRLQTSDPTAHVPSEWLQAGKRVYAVSTAVGFDEEYRGSGIQLGSVTKLESHTGAYSRKVKVRDSVIRREINRRQNGYMPEKQTGSVTTGYAWHARTKEGKEIPFFMNFVEAELLNSIEKDREWAMWYGKASVRKSENDQYETYTAPGFRQLCKDGNEQYHNGSLTADQIEDFFATMLYNRVDEDNRERTLMTGELGLRMFSQILGDESSAVLIAQQNGEYIRTIPGMEQGELEYGYQFRSFKARNGMRIKVAHNPMLDNPEYCERRYPYNTAFTIDSARMDVLDFGYNAESPIGSNIGMIKLSNFDQYYLVGGAIDPRSGYKSNGEFLNSGEKAVTYHRQTSGSLCVWDTGRIGSLIYEPTI